MIDIQFTCTVAATLAGLSAVLSIASFVGRQQQAPQDGTEPPATPVTVTAEPQAHHPRPSLKLTRMELLQHARDLGVKNARWRNRAKKVDLMLAIREHNQNREQGS